MNDHIYLHEIIHRTEQETLERALDMVLAEQRIVRVLRRGKAIGGFEDVFRRR